MPTNERQLRSMADILSTDLMGNRFEYMHEPLGDIAVWNGQFERGAIDDNTIQQPEGWQVDPWGAGSEGIIDTGGLAGNYCYKGGQAGVGSGPLVASLRYIPVDENREYMLSAAFKGSTAAADVTFGVECFDANKAWLGFSNVLTNYAPGVAWIRRQMRVGPQGDAAFQAGTRYIRVSILLQATVANGLYTWVDDVQFQQMKMVYSPGLNLDNHRVHDATNRTNATAAYVQHAGSPMTLTLEEPGYIWCFYTWSWSVSVTGVNTAYASVYIDGAAQPGFYAYGAVANYINSGQFAMRSAAPYARGAHTVDFRFRRTGAGTVTIYDLDGAAFYARQY